MDTQTASQPAIEDPVVQTGTPREINIDHLIIEDNEPVDNQYSEKQMRLWTEPLYSSWRPGRPFMAFANVGLFIENINPAIVPDTMLSMDLEPRGDLNRKANRTYLVWDRGKLPEVVAEVVSQTPGGEDTFKMRKYESMRIPHYVIWDPKLRLSKESLRYFEWTPAGYKQTEMRDALAGVGISLGIWKGVYENELDVWLRWRYPDGRWVLTGKELADRATSRADRATSRADRATSRADRATSRADLEASRADREAAEKAKLLALLRQHGIDPTEAAD